jgi:hypothetical protein
MFGSNAGRICLAGNSIGDIKIRANIIAGVNITITT